MSDLPKGYRWATEDEMDRDDVVWILLTKDSNGILYTGEESDAAVPVDSSADIG